MAIAKLKRPALGGTGVSVEHAAPLLDLLDTLVDAVNAIDPDGDSAVQADEVAASTGSLANIDGATVQAALASLNTLFGDLAAARTQIGADPAATIADLLAAFGSSLEDYVQKTAVVAGAATILNGTTSIAVSGVGTDYNGKPVLVSFAESPGTAAAVWGVVSGGNLTITVDADPGTDLTVNYWIVDSAQLAP